MTYNAYGNSYFNSNYNPQLAGGTYDNWNPMGTSVGAYPTTQAPITGGLPQTRNVNPNRGRPVLPSPPVGNRKADFATVNIKGKRNFAGVRNDLNRILGTGAGVIGLQEARGIAGQRIAQYARNHNFGIYGGQGTPILYDKSKYKMLGAGSQKLSNKTFVGSAGAGPAMLKQKLANVLLLKSLQDGQRRTFTNVHLAPSQYIPVRGQLARQQILRTAALQQQLERMFPHAQHYTMGDFNQHNAQKLKALARAGMQLKNAPGATFRPHGDSPDWLMSDAAIRNRWLMDIGSDHDAYFGSYR